MGLSVLQYRALNQVDGICVHVCTFTNTQNVSISVNTSHIWCLSIKNNVLFGFHLDTLYKFEQLEHFLSSLNVENLSTSYKYHTMSRVPTLLLTKKFRTFPGLSSSHE